MIEDDLAACNDFGGSLTHTLNDVAVPLPYLSFDEQTEVVIDHAEATVPTVLMQTSVAAVITHKSRLTIDAVDFEITEIDNQKDSTTILYLERL